MRIASGREELETRLRRGWPWRGRGSRGERFRGGVGEIRRGGVRLCHSERREESRFAASEILRSAQDDPWSLLVSPTPTLPLSSLLQRARLTAGVLPPVPRWTVIVAGMPSRNSQWPSSCWFAISARHVVNAVRPHNRADLDDVALERGFPAAGHLNIDRHFAALHLVRIVFALFDGAFDMQHIHPQQREDGIARLDPFVLVAFDLFDDAIKRALITRR